MKVILLTNNIEYFEDIEREFKNHNFKYIIDKPLVVFNAKRIVTQLNATSGRTLKITNETGDDYAYIDLIWVDGLKIEEENWNLDE